MEMETNEPAGPHMSEKHMGSSLDDFLKEEECSKRYRRGP
jgi:hypothetical protein